MDLSKLHAFVVVATELNFRKSAELLGMSQPPLTRLIASLEEELSTKLFERTTRQVKLTGAGVYLLKEGREILERVNEVEKEVRTIGKLKTGTITIGFSMATFMAALPKITNEFQERFPGIKLELQQESSSGILKGLKSGKFDAGFLEGTITESGLMSSPVREESLGVLLPRKHPLAKKKLLELADLRHETIILHPRKEANGFFNTVSILFAQSGIKPKTYIKKEHESCPILVATGKGVSLTIQGVHNFAHEETKFVPIKRIHLPVSVFWMPDNSNPSLKSFLSFVAESTALKKPKAECLMDVLGL